MSDTDSFIEEVSDELRRDRLFAMLRRYGWIAVLAILAIVGGTAWTEWQRAQTRAAAQAAGDAMVAAMQLPQPLMRAQALGEMEPATPGGRAVRDFLMATELANDGQTDAARAALEGIATNGDLPEIYRQIAAFKALTLGASGRDPAELRTAFEALAQPGLPLRLLAEEQLALIDIRTGDIPGAIARLQSVIADAEVTSDLQDRARQAIVALGGTPEAAGASGG